MPCLTVLSELTIHVHMKYSHYLKAPAAAQLPALLLLVRSRPEPAALAMGQWCLHFGGSWLKQQRLTYNQCTEAFGVSSEFE